MNIRKSLWAVLAAMCIFTTCGGDDDPDNGTPNNPDNDSKLVAAAMNVSLTVGDDMFNYLDLTVEYYDADGKVQSEQLTEKTWKKSMQAKLPATLGARLKGRLKNGVDPTSIEMFRESLTFAYGYYCLNASGKDSNTFADGSKPDFSLEGYKLPDWIEKHGDNIVKVLYVFDANGKATESNW